MQDARSWIAVGSVAALAAVVLGAFGTHGLSGRVEPGLLEIFDTGVRYHMYHAFGLLIVGVVALRRQGAMLALAGWAFLAGIVIFSGSLYAMTATGARWLGAITPLGGGAFIVGWLALAVGVRRDLG